MAASLGWLSLLPPVITIGLALRTKRVLPSLFAGIIAAHVLLSPAQFWQAPFAAITHFVAIATDKSNFLLILFSLMVGGLLALIREGRGFDAFAEAIARRSGGRRTTYGLTLGIAGSMFLDVWSNVLVNGATNGPLFDRLRLSRLRLAYYMHTVAICVVAMAMLNGWGAFYMGLLRAQDVAAPFEFIVASIPYMVYNWAALLLVPVVMATGLSVGPMRQADRAALESEGETVAAPGSDADDNGVTPSALYMVVPLALLVVTVFAALWVSGKGDILAGDANLAITFGVLVASAGAALLLIAKGGRGFVAVEDAFVGGMAKFFDIGILIVFALALGALVKDLGTGSYIAQLAGTSLPFAALPPLIFLLGAVMSFATGTSYGTFSIMVPIALPMAAATGIDPHLMFGAVISGGLFGDNTSPISDTSIMTALGAQVKIMDHVATQLPYALVAAAVACTGFAILGAIG